MSAYNTGLPAYTDGTKTVYAAKITELTSFDVPNVPNLKGCMKLFMGDIVKEANVVPTWIADNPDVAIGGYLLAVDNVGKVKLEYQNPTDFESRFQLVEEAKEQ